MTTTPQEINEAIEELKNAMLENITIGIQEDKIKIQKTASHFRLLKAKENLHALELN